MFRRLSFPQLLFAMLVGVGAGVYIYKPIYKQYYWEQKKLEAGAAKVEETEWK